MLQACLPVSDNNIAENLLLMSAGKLGPLEVDPYPFARQMIEKFATTVVGIPKGDVHPFDGSGLSRHDLVTTHAVTKLLAWANAQPTSFLWRQALAQPGKKGTLENRLVGLNFQGKTGTLDMCVALSGYIHTTAGKDLIASVIINEYACSDDDARSIEDDFIKAVASL
jgi:serine-type D-Ala-D-Ala carboxypeptidase/endopeptidase (penicillin-binding protein 4)